MPPTATASPTASATASPTPTILLQPTATLAPLNTAPWQPIIGASVGENVSFTSCAALTPVQFTGTVTTTDATVIQFNWVLSLGNSKTYDSPTQKIDPRSPGTYKVLSSSVYNAKCGKYALSLVVLYPNPLKVTKYFSIP